LPIGSTGLSSWAGEHMHAIIDQIDGKCGKSTYRRVHRHVSRVLCRLRYHRRRDIHIDNERIRHNCRVRVCVSCERQQAYGTRTCIAVYARTHCFSRLGIRLVHLDAARRVGQPYVREKMSSIALNATPNAPGQGASSTNRQPMQKLATLVLKKDPSTFSSPKQSASGISNVCSNTNVSACARAHTLAHVCRTLRISANVSISIQSPTHCAWPPMVSSNGARRSLSSMTTLPV
jgi:hypothetical protein